VKACFERVLCVTGRMRVPSELCVIERKSRENKTSEKISEVLFSKVHFIFKPLKNYQYHSYNGF
jgi:hypothetical protein